jgi:hypothetical protein
MSFLFIPTLCMLLVLLLAFFSLLHCSVEKIGSIRAESMKSL